MNRLALLFLVLLAVCGCGGNASLNRAHVRFINFAPAGSRLDFYVNGTRAVQGLDYKSNTGFANFDPGSTNFAIKPLSSGSTLASTDHILVAAQSSSVVAIGLEPDYQVAVFEEDSVQAGTGETRLRLSHVAPSVVGAVDWYLTQGNVDLNSISPTVAGMDFGVAGVFTTMPVGTWRIRATLAGTKTVVLDTSLLLGSRRSSTLYLRDKQGGGAPAQASLIDSR